MRYAFTLNGQTHHVVLEEHADGPKFVVEDESFEPKVERNGKGYRVHLGDETFTFDIHHGRIETKEGPMDIQIRRARPQVIRAGRGKGKGDGRIKPPMPGKIVEVHVADGDEVDEGQTLVVLEAMKMQNDIKSPFAGTVSKIHVASGQNVEATTVLVEVAPAEAAE